LANSSKEDDFLLVQILRKQWKTFSLLIANCFPTKNIGGAKELVVLL